MKPIAVERVYPLIWCQRHPSHALLDVLETDGRISRVCPACEPLREYDVVRGLHKRIGDAEGGK